jgi:hypothetical protein
MGVWPYGDHHDHHRSLSHNVIKASTGASAEIISLPNCVAMRYLRQH